MSDSAALGQAIGKRVPKTAKGRRILRKREPQVVEDPKTALIIRGTKCTNETTVFLRELFALRRSLSTLFMQKHAVHPFEDHTAIEKFCTKSDHNLFVFGSSSKKRPFRVIFGRLFDGRLLDMLEYGVKDYKSMNHFHASKKEVVVGSKPLVVFQGPAFDTNERLKRTKSLLMDYFCGARADKVLLQGLDHVIVVTAFEAPSHRSASDALAAASGDSDPPISIRRFSASHKKSGSSLPRIELEEIGPRFTLTIDRSKGPDKDRWKQSIKVPKAAKPAKVKNVSKDTMGKRTGRIHLGKQDFDQIHTVHHGEAKRRKLAEAKREQQAAKEGGGGGDGGGGHVAKKAEAKVPEALGV
eukprot:TRINITY_DN2978_c0_g1_i2.p1 TRINITY_DN2978_c0_g1~~TRINITY_DN2978_c0_g1_i2.p1  ORF type:complete len:355 (+),score=70.96 TRINITY_DN2978_c0_g1_i2:89-1153(+)